MSNSKEYQPWQEAEDEATNTAPDEAAVPAEPLVFVVDDDKDVRETLRYMLAYAGYRAACFGNAATLLDENLHEGSCLIADVRMPGMDGFELQREIANRRIGLPVILITGAGDVPLAVRAMQIGAFDFILKPFDETKLLSSIRTAVADSQREQAEAYKEAAAHSLLKQLTKRELEIFHKLVQGRANKIAALELGISPRTVEVHRASVMRKLNAHSVSDLVRIALAAQPGGAAG